MRIQNVSQLKFNKINSATLQNNIKQNNNINYAQNKFNTLDALNILGNQKIAFCSKLDDDMKKDAYEYLKHAKKVQKQLQKKIDKFGKIKCGKDSLVEVRFEDGEYPIEAEYNNKGDLVSWSEYKYTDSNKKDIYKTYGEHGKRYVGLCNIGYEITVSKYTIWNCTNTDKKCTKMIDKSYDFNSQGEFEGGYNDGWKREKFVNGHDRDAYGGAYCRYLVSEHRHIDPETGEEKWNLIDKYCYKAYETDAYDFSYI